MENRRRGVIMNRKTKKRIIDIVLTVLILAVSFGISILFQKYDVWEQTFSARYLTIFELRLRAKR